MPPPVLRTYTPGDAPRAPASGPRSVFRLFRGCKKSSRTPGLCCKPVLGDLTKKKPAAVWPIFASDGTSFCYFNFNQHNVNDIELAQRGEVHLQRVRLQRGNRAGSGR